MKSPTPMNSETMEYVNLSVESRTPGAVREAIATQVDRMREARRRIETEGIVVRDMKGSVIAHPAIAIEAAAVSLLNTLMTKWGERRG